MKPRNDSYGPKQPRVYDRPATDYRWGRNYTAPYKHPAKQGKKSKPVVRTVVKSIKRTYI